MSCTWSKKEENVDKHINIGTIVHILRISNYKYERKWEIVNSVLLLILFVRFLWFLRIRVQCQYTLFSYVVSYNISTLCCKVVLEWPRPNVTNDEANKWGDLVYGVPEAFKKHQQTKTLVSTHKSVVKQQSSKLGLCMFYLLDIFYAHTFWHIFFKF